MVRLRDYQDVADSTDVPTLESRLVRFANDLGFGIISGALLVELGAGRLSTFHFGNTPEAFQSTFANTDVGKRDPVVRRLRRLSTPFVYDQSMYVDEEAGDLWEMQALFGYKTGIAMALHLPGGKHFVMGVDRDQPLPGDDVQLTRMMADLQLLAVHAQDTAVRLLAPQALELQHMPSLTDREIEILKWTSDGKSAWAVGQILNLTEHNVKYHVKRILGKLGVSSKHQAVAKAKILGLI
jgi:DNA-binding CsgD family transcriptional regulator